MTKQDYNKLSVATDISNQDKLQETWMNQGVATN